MNKKRMRGTLEKHFYFVFASEAILTFNTDDSRQLSQGMSNLVYLEMHLSLVVEEELLKNPW